MTAYEELIKMTGQELRDTRSTLLGRPTGTKGSGKFCNSQLLIKEITRLQSLVNTPVRPKRILCRSPKKAEIVVNQFDTVSRQQFLDGNMLYFGSDVKSNISCDTIVVCVDKTSKEVFAVARVENCSDTNSPCRLHHLLDPELYTGTYAKYSKYEIKIKKLNILPTPVSYENIRTLVGGEISSKPNNVWKNTNTKFAKVFGVDPLVKQRHRIWVESLI